MKKVIIGIVAFGLLIVAASGVDAKAALCESYGGAGSIMLDLPTLPSQGTYTIWSRIQVPDKDHSRYMLEVNGDKCYLVGGGSITPKEWVWVSHQDGIKTNNVQYDFKGNSNNYVKLIGFNAGVKVDRLLLVKNNCVPEGLGTNCRSDAVPVAAIDTSGATEVPPPSNGSVRGLIILSQTVSLNPGSIKRVVYYVDGKPFPVSDNFGLDTTLLTNGMHRVSMQITKADSSIINEVVTINVNNPESAFTPVRRWSRLNYRNIAIVSSLIGGVLLLTAAFFIIRHIKLQKRLLHFRGF